MALESAYAASQTILQGLAAGDLSAAFLRRYEKSWNSANEMDWRTGDLFLSIARNPNLREFYLSLLRSIAALARDDARFQEFCGGLFSGVTPARKAVCPSALWQAAPLNPAAWARAAAPAQSVRGFLDLSLGAVRGALKVTERMLTDPVTNLRWFTEILAKAAGLVNCYGAGTLGVAGG